MGYLQALQLMVRAYKAAKGVMPKGLDLLKLKMRARKKAIDSTKGKLIQFPKDKITPFQKPRPTETEIMMKQTGIPVTVKGKTTTMTPDGILKMLMGKGKGKDVTIGKAPKTTKVKEPVDPKLVQQESIKDLYKRLMRSNREAIKNFKNRNKPRDDKANGGPIDPSYLGIPPVGLGTGSRPGGHPYPSLDYYDDDAGVKGLMKKRKKKKKKREKKATGGLANISQTYDNNPTLQSQFPNKQDYLDLFSSTTTTTPQTQTYAQMTQQAPAGIPAAKPIKPIIQPLEGEGGGGTGPKGFDKGYSSANFGLGPNKDVVDYEAEAYGIGRTPLGTASAIITGIPSVTKLGFQFAKSAKQKAKDALENFFTARAEAKAKKVARIARKNLAASMGSDAGPGEGAGTFGASVNEATGARGSGTGFSDYT